VTNHKRVTWQPALGVRVLPGLINSHPDPYPDDPYPATRRVLPTRANHYCHITSTQDSGGTSAFSMCCVGSTTPPPVPSPGRTTKTTGQVQQVRLHVPFFSICTDYCHDRRREIRRRGDPPLYSFTSVSTQGEVAHQLPSSRMSAYARFLAHHYHTPENNILIHF
jgi:hypothetical protein